MKKVIVLAFALVLASSASAQQPAERLAVVVSGFQNGPQALQMIVDYARNKGGDQFVIVSRTDNPDVILDVRATVTMVKSWSQINRNAVTRNSVMRAGNQITRDLIYSIPGNNRVARTLKNAGQSVARGQFQAQQRQEWEHFQKWRASVEIRMIDAKTRQVYSYGIGQKNVTVRNYRGGGEPQVILIEGDLNNVDFGQGANLDGNLRQILALSAFLDADQAQNQIVRQ